MYEALGRYDDAVIDYKAVLKAAPNDPSGWNNLVTFSLAAFRAAPRELVLTVTQHMWTGVTFAPSTAILAIPECFAGMQGNVRMAQGAWKEAADFYGKAYKLAPQFSFAAANQSLALYQQGRMTEAVREMRRASRGFLHALTSLCCAELMHSRCRTLLRRFPDFPDMRAALAAASWRVGDVGEAETNWARVEDPRYGDLTWLARWRRWPPRIREDLENFLAIKASSG